MNNRTDEGLKKEPPMRKNSISFLKIKVYRRKFLGTAIAILLLCTICFIGVSAFFTTIWAGQQRQEAQDAFSIVEKKIGNIKDQLNEYIEGCYAGRTMMQDAMALFTSGSEPEYLKKRLYNSRSTTAQIAYMPGDMKKLFINSRIQVRGATFVSESGIKAVWLDRLSGDMHVTFGLDREEDALDSYTHLTLPTSEPVVDSGGGARFKKKKEMKKVTRGTRQRSRKSRRVQ